MDVQVKVEYLKYASFELHDISSQLSKVLSELDEAGRELRGQTEFGSCLQALSQAKEDVALEKYKIDLLSQALMNIGSEYRRAEMKIEDSFEIQKPEQIRMDVGKVDLSTLYDRAKQLLYGGEMEWQL